MVKRKDVGILFAEKESSISTRIASQDIFNFENATSAANKIIQEARTERVVQNKITAVTRQTITIKNELAFIGGSSQKVTRLRKESWIQSNKEIMI